MLGGGGQTWRRLTCFGRDSPSVSAQGHKNECVFLVLQCNGGVWWWKCRFRMGGIRVMGRAGQRSLSTNYECVLSGSQRADLTRQDNGTTPHGPGGGASTGLSPFVWNVVVKVADRNSTRRGNKRENGGGSPVDTSKALPRHPVVVLPAPVSIISIEARPGMNYYVDPKPKRPAGPAREHTKYIGRAAVENSARTSNSKGKKKGRGVCVRNELGPLGAHGNSPFPQRSARPVSRKRKPLPDRLVRANGPPTSRWRRRRSARSALGRPRHLVDEKAKQTKLCPEHGSQHNS